MVGWGPTVREIDYLSGLFDEVVHVAPLHTGAPESAIAYESSRVRFRPVPPAGGERLIDKLSILVRAPVYLRTILKELRGADVIHVRCPANISLLAVLMLAILRGPRLRWVKYAGNWRPAGEEAWSYKFQRWLLNKGLHRGVVTINGRWPAQPPHVHSFLNPCLTEQEIREAQASAGGKEINTPLRLIYVGRLERAKGVDKILRVLADLKQRGLSATLDLVGDGPERVEFEELAATLEVNALTTYHGWLPRARLAPLYAQAHIIILPSSSEGWPKVLSEAMAYGVVPIASRVSSIPQYLKRFGTGRTCAPDDIEGFAGAVVDYVLHPQRWKEESRNGAKAAQSFSYSNYLEAVRNLLEIKLNIGLETALNDDTVSISVTPTESVPVIVGMDSSRR